MKIDLKHNSAFDLTVSSKFEASEVNEIFDTVYKDIIKNAKIKGFRKNKTPVNVIKASFATRATSMVFDKIIEKVFYYLESQSISIVELKSKDLIKKNPPAPNKNYEFSLDFKIQPVIKIQTELKGMTLNKPKNSVTPKDIDRQINFLKKMGAVKKLTSLRGAKEEDILILDVEVEIDEEYSQTFSKKPGVIYLSKNSCHPVMFEQLIGMKPFEEKVITITSKEKANFENFIDNFKKKYSVKLFKIIEHEDVKLDLKPTNQLEEAANKRAQIEIQQKGRSELENKICETLLKDQTQEVSKEDLLAHKNLLKSRLRQMMFGFGFSDQKIERKLAQYEKQIETYCSNQYSLDLIFSHLIKNLKITVSKDDIEERLRLIHLREAVPLSMLKQKYSDRQSLLSLEFSIAKDRVFDYIISNANFVDPEVQN